MMKNVVEHLPQNIRKWYNCNASVRFEDFSSEEIRNTSSKLKNNEAPTPGYISREIVKAVGQQKPLSIVSL